MLLSADENLSIPVISIRLSVEPTEFVTFTYLNHRFCSAVDVFYAFNERAIIDELSRIYQLHFSSY